MSLFQPTYTDKKTGEKKQSATWWYEFVYAGKRYRESAETTRKTLAANSEKARRLALEQQMTSGVRAPDPRRMLRTVKEAVEAYIAAYDAPTHSEKSIAWVKERLPHVVKHLGSVAIFDLTEAKALGYMRTRQGEGAGHRTITSL
jgi:hypothetical protein